MSTTPEPQEPHTLPRKPNEELVEEVISAALAAAITGEGWAFRADMTAHAADLMTLRANLDAQKARAARQAGEEE